MDSSLELWVTLGKVQQQQWCVPDEQPTKQHHRNHIQRPNPAQVVAEARHHHHHGRGMAGEIAGITQRQVEFGRTRLAARVI